MRREPLGAIFDKSVGDPPIRFPVPTKEFLFSSANTLFQKETKKQGISRGLFKSLFDFASLK
jgi:hypothetical protein